MFKLYIVLALLIQNLEAQSFEYKPLTVEDYDRRLTSLSELSASELVQKIKSENVEILIFQTGKKIANPYQFSFGEIIKPTVSQAEVTKIPNLSGKTFCENELSEKWKNKTIFLADHTSKSTLYHEYLHILQILKNPKWCEVSARISKQGGSQIENALAARMEEEVVAIMSAYRSKLARTFKDHAKICEGEKDAECVKDYLELYHGETEGISNIKILEKRKNELLSLGETKLGSPCQKGDQVIEENKVECEKRKKISRNEK